MMRLAVTYLLLGMLLTATATMAETDDALIKAGRQVVKSQKIVKASREAAESAQRFIIANDKEISTRQSQLDAAKRTEEDQATQFAATTAALKSSPGDRALRQAQSNRADELDSARRSTRAMESALKDAKIERDRAASNSSKAQAALEAATEALGRARDQFADVKIDRLKEQLGRAVNENGEIEEGPCLADPIPVCERRLLAQATEQALNIGRTAIQHRVQKEFGLSPDEITQVAKITVSGEPKVTELNADKRGGRARVNAVVAGQLTASGEASLRSRWGGDVVIKIDVSERISQGVFPSLRVLLDPYYDSYDFKRRCWIAKFENSKYCVVVDRSDVVVTSSGKRLYVLTIGDDINNESHAAGGMVGAFVFEYGKSKALSSRPVVYQIGSWGKAPSEWELIKLGSVDYWGWINSSGYYGQGISSSSHSILAPQGKEVREIFSTFASYDDVGGADGCAKDGCSSMEASLKVDPTKTGESIFPLLVTVTGMKKGKSLTPKTWSFPFDKQQWKYIKPPAWDTEYNN